MPSLPLLHPPRFMPSLRFRSDRVLGGDGHRYLEVRILGLDPLDQPLEKNLYQLISLQIRVLVDDKIDHSVRQQLPGVGDQVMADHMDLVIGLRQLQGASDAGCTEYDRAKAADLMASIKEYPNLVFEGHSTDYQTRFKLRELVEDGVGILKVGPALTFALREGLFALAYAEKEQYRSHPEKQSYFMEVLDAAMQEQPKYFAKHYHGTAEEIALKRKFSFSDRCRYYLPQPEVTEALGRLMENFADGVPLNLLNQFMPVQYRKVREGSLGTRPKDLVYDWGSETIDDYMYATRQETL